MFVEPICSIVSKVWLVFFSSGTHTAHRTNARHTHRIQGKSQTLDKGNNMVDEPGSMTNTFKFSRALIDSQAKPTAEISSTWSIANGSFGSFFPVAGIVGRLRLAAAAVVCPSGLVNYVYVFIAGLKRKLFHCKRASEKNGNFKWEIFRSGFWRFTCASVSRTTVIALNDIRQFCVRVWCSIWVCFFCALQLRQPE